MNIAVFVRTSCFCGLAIDVPVHPEAIRLSCDREACAALLAEHDCFSVNDHCKCHQAALAALFLPPKKQEGYLRGERT